MKFLVIVAVSLCLFQLTKSATWRGDGSDPKHPGKCVFDKTQIIDYGQAYHPIDRCEKIECLQGGEMVGYSCGIKVMENCKDDGYVDVSKSYPDCCLKKFICKIDGEDKIIEM